MKISSHLDDIFEIAFKADFNKTEYLLKKHIAELYKRKSILENEIDRITYDQYCEDEYCPGPGGQTDILEGHVSNIEEKIHHLELLISSNRCKL